MNMMDKVNKLLEEIQDEEKLNTLIEQYHQFIEDNPDEEWTYFNDESFVELCIDSTPLTEFTEKIPKLNFNTVEMFNNDVKCEKDDVSIYDNTFTPNLKNISSVKIDSHINFHSSLDFAA